MTAIEGIEELASTYNSEVLGQFHGLGPHRSHLQRIEALKIAGLSEVLYGEQAGLQQNDSGIYDLLGKDPTKIKDILAALKANNPVRFAEVQKNIEEIAKITRDNPATPEPISPPPTNDALLPGSASQSVIPPSTPQPQNYSTAEIEGTDQRTPEGSLIYRLYLWDKTGREHTFEMVSGSPRKEDADRSQKETPLPPGVWNFDPNSLDREKLDTSPTDLDIINKELGGRWIALKPARQQTALGRSAFGMHVDPSWNKENGEAGTKGCPAFKTTAEFDSFLRLAKENKITSISMGK